MTIFSQETWCFFTPFLLFSNSLLSLIDMYMKHFEYLHHVLIGFYCCIVVFISTLFLRIESAIQKPLRSLNQNFNQSRHYQSIDVLPIFVSTWTGWVSKFVWFESVLQLISEINASLVAPYLRPCATFKLCLINLLPFCFHNSIYEKQKNIGAMFSTHCIIVFDFVIKSTYLLI